MAVRRYQTYLTERERNGSIRGGKLSSRTVQAHIRAIKVFLRWCIREEGVEEYVTERTANRIQLPLVEKRVVGIFTEEEVDRLFKACMREISTELLYRDGVNLSLLLDCGSRAAEICGLTLDKVHVEARGGSWVEVEGKGRKSREVGLGVEASKRLFKYISRYRKSDRNERHVFVGYTGKPFNTNTAAQLIERLAGWAGVEKAYMHKFRHTFAVNYLRAGGNLFDLQRCLGHESTATMELYLTAYSSQIARSKGYQVLDSLTHHVKSRIGRL